MDPMVSARVPVALRDPVNARLRAMGSSPTELIDKAYEFVFATGQLPHVAAPVPKGARTPSAEQLAALRSSVERTTYAVPPSYFAARTDDRILEDELRTSYEALS